MRIGSRVKIAFPAKVLLVYVFVTQFLTAIYGSYRLNLPLLIQLLYPLVLTWIVWWWISEDSKRVGQTWPMDFGLFLYIFWPLFVPYYLLKTRGQRGFIPIITLVGVTIAGWVAAAIVLVIYWG